MKYQSQKNQLSIRNCHSSITGCPHLNSWTHMGNLLPWMLIEKSSKPKLNYAISEADTRAARLIVGALIKKQKLRLSYKETIYGARCLY